MTGQYDPIVHRWGRADAVPFVMLHSLGLDGASFGWLADSLTRRADVQVVAPDLLGHGKRGEVHGTLSIDSMAGDVLDMMDWLGLKRAHLLGTSMGVTVARRAMEREPRRWLSATLIAGGPAAVPALAERGQPALIDGMSAVVGSTLQRWFSAEAVAADDEFVRYARECLLAMSPHAWAASWRALASYPALGSLPAAVPGLCIAGRQDASAPPQVVEALRLSAGVPHEIKIIEGGHHQLAMSMADDLAELLQSHWDI